MAKYNPNESLGKNAMRGVDITMPEPEEEQQINEEKSDLDGLSKYFFSLVDGKFCVYDEYEREVASFATYEEAKDYVANKDKEAYDKMWEFVMRHEAEECMLIVAEGLNVKLTDKQKEEVLYDYIYQTTACEVYDYYKMKATIKRILKEKKSA